MALGQGGLSGEPMWEQRLAESRALHPRLIRLFVQEYFGVPPRFGNAGGSLRNAVSRDRFLVHLDP